MKRRYPKLFFAADGLAIEPGETLEIIDRLVATDASIGIKTNIDYLLHKHKSLEETLGPLLRYDCEVMADLKLWNGGRTMASVIRTLGNLGVNYTNVYALAGNETTEAVEAAKDSGIKILFLATLSHYTEEYCQKTFRRSRSATARYFVKDSIAHACDGVIIPGVTLKAIKKLETFKMATGVRPSWFKDSRHADPVTPRFIAENGANMFPIGSPITKSRNPGAALQAILAEVRGEPFTVPE